MSEKNGPKEIKRDALGLVVGPEYSFTEDGRVDWRPLINSKFLVAKNRSEADPSTLEDKDLLILLGGTKEIAALRGFDSVSYEISSPSPDYVVVTCKISWLPNFETERKPVVFSSIGDASKENTTGIGGVYYLGPIAENRAFVRCVRNFLRINILGQDEIGVKVKPQPADTSDSSDGFPSQGSLLESLMKEKNVSFDNVKKQLEKDGYPVTDKLLSVDQLPKFKICEIIARLKKI